MSWFWQSSSSSPESEGSSNKSPSSSTTPMPPQAPPTSQTPPSQHQDREVAMFMNMLMKDTQSPSQARAQQQQQQQQQQSAPSTPTTPSNQDSKSTTTSWLPWTTTAKTPNTEQLTTTTPSPRTRTSRTPPSLAMSEHVLPTTMSCRDAFDYAWHCHTPGSQWNAVYRYGTVRTCTELWDDFWFCMRTKSYPPEQRAQAIKAHYRAKEEAKYGGGKPSSEDIWESRDERVKPGSVFNKRFDEEEEAGLDDAEVQRREAERRRRVRVAAGIEKEG
ncbi:hypothetical protein N657DRAFT_646231 [Parathielavia appendiculata]|uniref:Early meiotic induction protein 1 n=1 Tax=Parathielavia appendiculata TaxID=2587402 RepID=A0AAN6TXC6_9PEZI|nr:hypothetical protein N657DRAFT_646231 [Parathielavia appendiculata]